MLRYAVITSLVIASSSPLLPFNEGIVEACGPIDVPTALATTDPGLQPLILAGYEDKGRESPTTKNTTNLAVILNRKAGSSIIVRNDNDMGFVATIINRRFTFWKELLLLEEFKREQRWDREDQDSSVTVQAWAAANPAKRLWIVHEAGDEGQLLEYSRPFYRVTKHGCCAAESTHNYFNILSGQKVFSSTVSMSNPSDSLFEIEGLHTENSGKQSTRYIAYHSSEGSLPSVDGQALKMPFGALKSAFGIIQYGSASRVLKRLILQSKSQNYEALGTPTIRALYQGKLSDPSGLRGVSTKQDSSSLSDFSLVFNFSEELEVIVPVRNDDFDLTKAIVPEGFTLKTINVDHR
jgi:hypothetical protein